MRLLLTIFSLISISFAAQNFKEIRHMDALNVDRELYGSFEIKPEQMVVAYTKPNIQTITYYNDKICIETNNTKKEYSFDKYPQAQYMGVALKAIFEENYDLLGQFFKIQKQNNTNILLNSKAGISDIIDSIDITKTSNNIIKKIFIHMRNKDTILIETIN
jgi:hypothetical protein